MGLRRNDDKRSLPRSRDTSAASGCEYGAVRTVRRTPDPWQPVVGDDIGPTPAVRARRAVALFALLVFLGIAVAGALGMVALALLTLAGASIG